MKFTGAHVSAAGGAFHAPGRALEIGAEAFAIFTKNKTRWNASPLTPDAIDKFRINLEKSGIKKEHVLPHDSYLINLGNPDDEKRKKSLESFIDEMERVRQLGLVKLNFHPGAHMKLASEEECIKLIAECLDTAAERVPEVFMVIENTAGQGSSIGYKFEHLADIISSSRYPGRIGVCIDTCHTFAAGYDLRTKEGCEKTFSIFSEIIGFEKLMGMHLNDCKTEFASRVDRHAPIGKGNIGMESFRFIMNDRRFDDIPLILETPEQDIWPEEIKLLNSLTE